MCNVFFVGFLFAINIIYHITDFFKHNKFSLCATE